MVLGDLTLVGQELQVEIVRGNARIGSIVRHFALPNIPENRWYVETISKVRNVYAQGQRNVVLTGPLGELSWPNALQLVSF